MVIKSPVTKAGPPARALCDSTYSFSDGGALAERHRHLPEDAAGHDGAANPESG